MYKYVILYLGSIYYYRQSLNEPQINYLILQNLNYTKSYDILLSTAGNKNDSKDCWCTNCTGKCGY